ncbi:helix-turn-helix transcriptional regulator [Bradyrhizobium liaoningense]|uniref:helix-turn-helix transcriptional regulator n=1 Tax=Bradyrhizobium liaoningense TaxID=43992 RepID=UPI001BA66230|nr:helix-turn-helix transcriptional regulator [Bradyrhizobium liaoningense]MBR0882903.1 helix-turn-helix transcriptional regulator [Bradyrhizobium liaoningense]
MARPKKDRVMPHLLRAQTALRRERDAYLAGLLDKAITHRAATLASGQPRTSGPQPDKRVMKAIAFIHENLADRRMTLNSIAAASGSSMFHLARLFSAEIGLPPHTYVRQMRLQLARELLAHHQGMTIVDVALACGFASQAHFSTAFTKGIGLSPGSFRKKATALAQRKARR